MFSRLRLAATVWKRTLPLQSLFYRRGAVLAAGAAAFGLAMVSSAQQEKPLAELEEKPAEVPFYDFVLVGGGVAAFTAVRELLRLNKERGKEDVKILMIGDEEWAPYVRYPLSKNMWYPEDQVESGSGGGTGSSESWQVKKYVDAPVNGVERLHGLVRQLNLKEKVVYSVAKDTNATVPVRYGKLLIATGLKPHSLRDIADGAVANVSALRTIDDLHRIKEWWTSEKPTTVTVVGGGLLGPELIWAMAKNNPHGHKLQLLFETNSVMEKVWPQFLCEEATRRISALGVKVIPNSEAVAIADGGNGRAFVQLADDSQVESDRVIFAMGSHFDAPLYIRAGLEIDEERGGVLANAELQLRSDVWAAGDIVSFYDTTLGERRRVEHHEHAFWSGVVAAKNMMGAQMPYGVIPVEFGSTAGFQWEGVGKLDSKLDTVSFWDDAGPDPLEKGVIYYLDEWRSIVGVMTINLPKEKMDYAKLIVKEGPELKSSDEAMNLIYLG